MAQKNSTRGNKNTASYPKEGPAITESIKINDEKVELTEQSFQVKKTYQESLAQLKQYNEIIKTFLKEYGESLNLKELAELLPTKWYKPEKLQELTLENLKKIFVLGKVHKTVVYKEIDKGIVYNSIETKSKKVELTIDHLKEIIQDIDNSNLKSFKDALSLVSKSTYESDNSRMSYVDKQNADKYQQEITAYVLHLKKIDLSAFEENFFKPLLLETRNKTSIDTPKIVEVVKQAHEAFINREKLKDEIYQSSSAEVIQSIEKGDYKCKNPNNSIEIINSNNKIIKKISGEDDNLNLPLETTLHSDFVFHKEHATGQCELQETLRLEKDVPFAKAILLKKQVMHDCSHARIKEMNENYDLEMSKLSNSTAVAISNNNQEKCDQWTSISKAYGNNVVYLFNYRTDDDESIAAEYEKMEVVVSIDNDGQTTIGELDLQSKHSANSANIKDFDEIKEDLEKNNENAVKRAIEAPKGNLDFQEEINIYRLPSPSEDEDSSPTSSSEDANSAAPTYIGQANDTISAEL